MRNQSPSDLKRIPNLNPTLEVKLTDNKGRGVFATRDIEVNEVLEESPALICNTEHPELGNYVFCWGKGQLAIGLGYISMYNHSDNSNADWWNVESMYDPTICVYAKRDIAKGEEITIRYHEDPTELKFWGIQE